LILVTVFKRDNLLDMTRNTLDPLLNLLLRHLLSGLIPCFFHLRPNPWDISDSNGSFKIRLGGLDHIKVGTIKKPEYALYIPEAIDLALSVISVSRCVIFYNDAVLSFSVPSSLILFRKG
jgi:hypothetical protein